MVGQPVKLNLVALTRFRKATRHDIPALRKLIDASARGLGRGDYSDSQIEGALKGAWGVDETLIDDGTYFLLEEDTQIIACGGWSFRQTRFGSATSSEEPALDPIKDAARIRAFFVHPEWARRGIGRQLLNLCEVEAMNSGFGKFELVATLGGQRLYESAGYQAGPPIEHELGEGLTITFVPMRKG